MAEEPQVEPVGSIAPPLDVPSPAPVSPRSEAAVAPPAGPSPDRVEIGPEAQQVEPEDASTAPHLAAVRDAHRPPAEVGSTTIVDAGKRVAGGNTSEYQKFYLNHGNSYNIECKGTCAYGRPARSEEAGICEGTAALAHASTRTRLPASALPQKSDGDYAHAPIDAAATLQRASEQNYSLVSEHGGRPHEVLDRVLREVKQHGSSILGMAFTNPDGSKGTGHALLVTEVSEGTAAYTKPDGSTEPRPARIFHYLDPNLRDGLPDGGQQQAIVHFTGTNQVSWTRDVRQFYAPKPGNSDLSVPQRGTYLRRGELDMGSMSQTQVANLVRRLKQGSDYRARPAS